jgi:Mg2+ and Co2+ transporter CorA
MLRSDMPFRDGNRAVRLAAFFLGEAFLGFLAIISVALTLLQMWFPLTPAGETLVDVLQWSIVAMFAIEFLVALAVASSKKAFLTSPWRLIDVATVIIPLFTLIPGTYDALKSSPVLRLIRLARVATLGLRLSGVVARERKRLAHEQEPSGPVEVCMIPAGAEGKPAKASWNEFLQWLKSPDSGQKWFSVSNLGRTELRTLAGAADVPATFLESHLLNATYPHYETEKNFGVIFTWLVEQPTRSPVDRNGLLMLISADGLVTIARHGTDLTKLVEGIRLDPDLAKLAFPLRMACTILQLVMEQNERLVTHCDAELAALEELPLRESRPAFFERTFKLKKELSAAQSDLWRLKGVINELAEQRSRLPGSTGAEVEFLKRLSRDAEYLYESIVNTREGLLSLIDLHLNIVSFDMNRVMRVLAVVSVLGLIPAVVGGLFGMNLIDNPWPYTLKQVAFFIGFGMTLCLYFFFVKGWLR